MSVMGLRFGFLLDSYCQILLLLVIKCFQVIILVQCIIACRVMHISELDRTSTSVERDNGVQSRAHLHAAQAPKSSYWGPPLLQEVLVEGSLLLHFSQPASSRTFIA